jgi:hypothetical protein
LLGVLLDALLEAGFLLIASAKSASCCALSCSLFTIAYATAAPAAAPKIVPMIALPVILNPESKLGACEGAGPAGADVALVTLMLSVSGWPLRAGTKVVLSSSPRTFTIPLLHVRTRLPPETVVYASSSSSWW